MEFHSPFGRVGLSGPERALPGRYRVRPFRKREGEISKKPAAIGVRMGNGFSLLVTNASNNGHSMGWSSKAFSNQKT